MVDVVLVSIRPAPSMLQTNNVGVINSRTSNLKMELVKFVPLYYVTMLESMVTVTETPIVIVPAHTIVSMRSKP
jgi:hypothetical protein